MMDQLTQWWLAFFGVPAIFLVNRKDGWAKYGCLFGILGQPAWFYTAYTNDQWGVTVLCVLHTYSWMMGVWNNWIEPSIRKRREPVES